MKKYVIYFIFLSLSFLKLNGQNLITVPFSNGFVGDNSANNNSTNVYYTAGATGVGLGWTNLQFTQNSTASIFTLQGNDIVGSVLVTDASGLEKTIDGFIKWRAPSGSVTTMCFQPTTGTNVTLATNGTNGSSTYTITDTKYIGLTFNGQTLSISGVPGSVSGNAATSGLLDLLNNYLTLFPKLSVGNATVVEGTATITVPVTLSAAPTSDVKVYFSVSNGSAVLTSDFLNPTIPASGYFTFLASQPTLLTKNITIPIVNNAINEPTEYFNVILSDPTNASITDGLGIVTITDNDPIPTADAGPATAVICSNGTYTTTGTATNGTIAWTSSGTGTFANATLGATLYTPSAADIAAGTVTLTMSVTGSGLTVTDNVVLTINEVPTNISASVTTQPSSTVSTGTITVAAPTGANYLYSVNGSTYQPGLTFSSLAPGSYSVTVKNNTSGCISNPVLLTVNSYALAPAPAVAAGTCDPESLYDLIVSAFHQSVAQKNDGSWSGWGQHMDSDGSTSVTTPQDINVANYPGLTGIPLIATTASNIQDEQSVLLTTTGLFAWGVEGVAIPDAITTSTTFQKITINGKTDGLPTGVSPSDVQSLVAIHNNLILRTINGFAYILSCNTSGVTTANLYGDGSTSINNNWHQVKINATTALSNIIALRGQVASDTKGAFVALTYSASGYKAYTWGMSAYKGDNTSASALGYATEMTLPSGVTPRMIAITGGFYDAANTNTPLQRNNSYYLVATNGNVYGLGANDVKQLGDLTTTERKTWVQPKLNALTFLTNVKYLSAQEHDSRHPAVGVITNSGDLYLWGQNGGNMLGSSNTDASFDPFFPSGFTSGVDIAKVLEVGGHTTVYLKENSAKFCYVGHKTQGSMGDGITTSSNPFTFNCDATPVMNICGSTGWDLGDAPIVYENGGGSNYAQHFYIENSTKLYLGTSAPIENDDNPHSVIIATDNNGSNGDGTEENGIATFPTILNTATSYSFNVSLLNNSGLTANLYVWVDWNNNGKFEASEYKTTTATTSVSPQTKTISYTGLSGITDGRRYVRARLSTYSKADVTGTTNVDERSLGVLMDGEIEDYSLFVTTSNPNPNQFPITNDVTNAAILPLNASATDLDDASSSDSDGTVVAYRIIALPTHGTLYKQVGLSLVAMAANEAIVAADFAVLKYQPGANYAGNDVFTYTAIDDDGAEDQTPANFNIVVFVVSPSSDAGLATTTICANSTLTLNGTASNGTLLWSTLGSGTFSDATISNPIYTPSAADKAAGSVTLTLTVTGTSSTAIDSIIVTIAPLPTVDAGNATAAVCSGNNLSLNGTATNGTSVWTSTGTGSFNNANSLTSTYTPSATDISNGSVILYLTNTGTGSCSSVIVQDSLQLSITATPSTPVGSVTVQPTCATTTGTIVFTSQSGVEYSINGTTYQSSATFTGVSAGSYTLKVRSTTDNTCTATGATVTVNAAASAPSTPVGSVTVQPTCATTTGTIVFTTQTGVEYSINGTTYQSSATFTGVVAGSYTLRVRSTTDNTCSATGATITVNAAASAPSTPVGSVTVQPTCATTTGTIVFTTQSGVEYSINGTTYQSSATFTGVAAGSYTLRVRSTTDNTCTATGATVTVNAAASAPSTPVGSVTVQPTCATTTGTIVFTTQSGVEYSINGTTYQTSATFTGVAAGSYTLKVRSTTDNTCTATGATVTVNAAASAPSTPVGSVTVQPTCATTTGTIVFTSQSGVEYSINGTTYQTSATFTGVAAGSYTLKVRSTTDNTCSATGATITVNAAASAPSTPVGSVTVQPTCATTTGTIVFTTQSGVEYSINGTTYQASATFTGVAAGSYTLRVRSTTDNTCTATGATITVNAAAGAPSTPVGSVTVQPTCATTTGTIVFTSQSGVEYSINGTTYQSSSTFTGVSAGSYTLKVRSTTDNTCTATGATVTVYVPICAITDTMGPINGLIGETTASVLSNDTLNGVPVISSSITLTGLTVPPGLTLNPNGTITISPNTPAGTLTLTYQICENLNPTNCDTATVTVTVEAAAVIDAISDTFAPINGLLGATTASILTNDTLNGVAITASAITLTGVTIPTGLTLNPNGTITIAPNTPAGTLTLTYQICENLNPTNCDTATVTITVAAAVIDAITDTFGPINGLVGATTASVLVNDTLDEVAVTASAITLTGVTVPTGLTLNPNGSIDIANGTPAGTYSLTYQICENLNPTNCDTAVVTIIVTCNSTKVSGFVFNAGSNNTPLANVPITLTPINIVNGINNISGPSIIQITNSQGNYNYNGIPPGNYMLQVQDANLNVAFNLYNVTSSFLIINVEQCNYLVRNFSYNTTLQPVLGDFIWYDVNNNGLQDEWYDANNDGLVTKNIPDSNGIVDSTQWEWIDFNGDNSYLGLVNYGELNAAGFSNLTTNIPNLFISGPNGYNVDNTIGVQGFWGVRPPLNAYGIYNIELIMQSNLRTASLALAATGLIKVLPGGPAFRIAHNSIASKNNTNLTTNNQSSTICRVSNQNPQIVDINANNLVKRQLDFGISCKEFGAVDDIYTNNTSLTSGTLGNVMTNDILNGVYVATDFVNFSVVSGSYPTISIDNLGNVNITSGTPAGNYVFVYSLCDELDATNCVNATVTITVVPAVIDAISDTAGPINGLVGATTASVLTNDTLNGVAVIPSTITLTGVTVPTGLTLNANGTITIAPNTPAGTLTLTYQICENLNPTNCDTATVTITVVPAAIDAISDTVGPINGLVGATTASVLANDTLNGVAVTASAITLTGVTIPTGLTLNPNGTITIAPNTPAGTLTLTYQICENLNPTNCDTATVTITVAAAVIDAISDTAGPINGLVGATTASVLTNDTLNGVAITASAITLTGVTVPTGLTLNPNGTITIAPNTPAGTLTLTYQICENLNPTNCDTATVTITVAAAVIDAIADTAGPINGLVGATTASVLTNDTLNGVAVIPSTITLTGVTVPTGLTLNPNGTITIAPNTPAGTLTLTYQICENLNPTNCDTATVTITVVPAVIDAISDTVGPINGLVGATTASVLANDTLNGVAVTASAITLTGITVPTGLTLNPNGTITIAPNTSAGTLTLTYQICENLNPTNCDTATVTITVAAAVIDAISDTVGPINGLVGATTASILTNDTLNGVAVIPSTVTLTGVTVPTGLTLNPNGTITIAPNTPAGTLTLTYQICENLNPTNCDTATVTITVGSCLDFPLNDCDGDGVTNGQEISNGTNPNDSCSFILTSQTFTPSLQWLAADCDGDGVTNGQEINDGTNPLNPCSYNASSQTLTPNSQWLSADCDGDGVTNGQEIIDGTDLNNPCEADMSHATLPLTQEFLEGDCDGDGLTNGEEIGPNPNEPFDPNGNGIPDYLEVNNHTPSDDDLEIFNLVTPNGDGDNDVFVVRNIERYPENELEIYNRWGVKVYSVDGYGQDGKFFRGISEGRVTVSQVSELPVGTYWYVLKYKNATGEWKQRVGYLYLNK